MGAPVALDRARPHRPEAARRPLRGPSRVPRWAAASRRSSVGRARRPHRSGRLDSLGRAAAVCSSSASSSASSRGRHPRCPPAACEPWPGPRRSAAARPAAARAARRARPGPARVPRAAASAAVAAAARVGLLGRVAEEHQQDQQRPHRAQQHGEEREQRDRGPGRGRGRRLMRPFRTRRAASISSSPRAVARAESRCTAAARVVSVSSKRPVEASGGEIGIERPLERGDIAGGLAPRCRASRPAGRAIRWCRSRPRTASASDSAAAVQRSSRRAAASSWARGERLAPSGPGSDRARPRATPRRPRLPWSTS